MQDLTPVRIGSDGAKIAVDKLRVLRDIYYLAYTHETVPGSFASYGPAKWDQNGYPQWIKSEKDIAEVMSNPARFQEVANTREVEFELGEGQFLACGDNSPESSDSRLWSGGGNTDFYVDRDLLVGKALLVHWPHGWEIPGTNQAYLPNFKRMRLIH